jgi:hypothetical protein
MLYCVSVYLVISNTVSYVFTAITSWRSNRVSFTPFESCVIALGRQKSPQNLCSLVTSSYRWRLLVMERLKNFLFSGHIVTTGAELLCSIFSSVLFTLELDEVAGPLGVVLLSPVAFVTQTHRQILVMVSRSQNN